MTISRTPNCSAALFLVLCLFFPRPADSGTSKGEIIFAFPAIAYPPYVMHDEDGRSGILFDVFETVAGQVGYAVTKKSLPEKRITRELEVGTVDGHPTASEWVENPGAFVWTDAILVAEDHLVYRRDNPISGVNSDILAGGSLATMKDFLYPSLEARFANGEFQRIDTRSFDTLLKLVALKRVTAGVLDHHVGRWTMRQSAGGYQPGALAFSENGFESIGYKVRLTPTRNWVTFLKQFNSALGGVLNHLSQITVAASCSMDR